jgi:hypothetical protein
VKLPLLERANYSIILTYDRCRSFETGASRPPQAEGRWLICIRQKPSLMLRSIAQRCVSKHATSDTKGVARCTVRANRCSFTKNSSG